jgi:cytochrome c-type biogenesis protein CcmH
MGGWVILLGLAAVTGGLLWRFAPLGKAAREFLLAALLLGLAGYAWQGNPGMAGHPTKAKGAEMQPDSAFAQQRQAMMGRFGGAGQWLDYADALHRMGYDRSAVTAIKSGLKERPNDAELWVGLGNALVLHGDGLVSPAARLAFERAARLAPDHPGPPYFLGLAYAQAGQVEQAAAMWRDLLARAPADAPWRADVEQKLAMLEGGQP